MKKILLSVVAVIALATVSNAQFKVGVKAGGNLNKLRINGESPLFSNSNFKSYHAGLVGDLQVTDNISLQPQLLYVRKGATVFNSKELGESTLRMNYIDLGTNVLYKVPLGFGKAFVGAGISGSYCINGTQETNGQKSKLYSDIKSWKRYDLSYGLTAGLELNNGFFASINSEKSLLDISKESGTIKNRTYAVSVGYYIGWNKLKRRG